MALPLPLLLDCQHVVVTLVAIHARMMLAILTEILSMALGYDLTHHLYSASQHLLEVMLDFLNHRSLILTSKPSISLTQ